jgi:hypothetical protein
MLAFLEKEFDKLPQNIRYLFALGILLVFNAWLLDHWLQNRELPYLFLGRFDIRGISYNVGTTLFLTGIVAILLKQVIAIPSYIYDIKRKYSIDKLGKQFDLVWFQGKLYLFEYKSKKYFHVRPWETAEDLNFVSYGTHVEDKFPNPNTPKVTLNSGKILNTEEYQNGGFIDTRK